MTPEQINMEAATNRELRSEVERLTKLNARQKAFYQQVLRDAEELISRDASELTNMLQALKSGDKNIKQAVEAINLWKHGNYREDIPPPENENVHLHYCNQGEYDGVCRYGPRAKCPAFKGAGQ